MRHIVVDVPDLPPAPLVRDRRCTPDRRTEWRGGRRDNDWVNRPLGGLSNLETRQRRAASPFRRVVFSVLHLW